MAWNTKIPIFRRFVLQNFPFIEEDFDALTDYQLISKVVEYLNKVINSQNGVIGEVARLSELFTELKSFVDNYFDNLDVQEEINNKLDAMAEDGTLQEIITAYIQSNVAWTFDTVADMKLSENLIAGSYAQTLGFHDINDGGGALYYITDSGTANEMDIIEVGTLYANLVYGKSIDVKQVGAYGDDTHNDYAAINRAYQIASNDSIILEFPKSTYKVDEQLTLKHIVIDCKGKIDNALALILGANSNGSTKTSVFIAECNDVQIEGAKNSYFNIEHAQAITLFANGSISDNTSIAYNIIDGITCNSFTINGINNGWINENRINIKRCNGNLTITGDGSYVHNNNKFNNICIEGSTKKIKIDYGGMNTITYRGESIPVLELNSDVSKCYANTIQREYSSAWSTAFSLNDFNNTSTFNFVGVNYLPSYKHEEICSLDLTNAKKFNNSAVFINNNNHIFAGYQHIFESGKIEADFPFTIYVTANTDSQRMTVTCYDADNNKIPGNVGMPGVTYNTTTKNYATTSNAKRILLNFTPSSEVKYVEIMIQGGAVEFDWMKVDLYTPYLCTKSIKNTLKFDGKYSSQIPSTLTANNPTWEVGDIVYNSAPTPGGTFAWVCTTAGTGSASVWKEIGIAE